MLSHQLSDIVGLKRNAGEKGDHVYAKEIAEEYEILKKDINAHAWDGNGTCVH